MPEILEFQGRVTDREIVRKGQTNIVCASRTHFVGCTFKGLRFTDTISAGRTLPFGGVTFENCVFEDCRVQEPDIGNGTFLRCHFAGGEWRTWFAFTETFISNTFECRLKKVIFHGRDVTMPRLLRRRNKIVGNNFQNSDMIDCAFRAGVDLSRQTFPQNSQVLVVSDARAFVSRTQLLASRVSGDLSRRLQFEADDALREIEDGQMQVYLDRSDGSSDGLAVWGLLVDEFAGR